MKWILTITDSHEGIDQILFEKLSDVFDFIMEDAKNRPTYCIYAIEKEY